MDLLRLSCALVVLFSTTTICNAALGEVCTESSLCDDANAACTGDDVSKTCTCLPTFKKDGDNPCVAIVPGDPCTANGRECADIENSACKNDVCTCDATHKPAGGSCVPKALGDTCTVDGGECADITHSVCVDDAGTLKCTCKATHKQVDGSCVPKGLGDSCQTPSDCNTDDAICESTSEKCECGTEFVAQAGACKVAVDGVCSDSNSEKCVGNAECNEDKCTCVTNYVPVADFCVPENGSRGNLASVLVVILSLATAFQF